jgi:hypothetical protein
MKRSKPAKNGLSAASAANVSLYTQIKNLSSLSADETGILDKFALYKVYLASEIS